MEFRLVNRTASILILYRLTFRIFFYPFNSLLYVYTDSQGVRGPPTALVSSYFDYYNFV